MVSPKLGSTTRLEPGSCRGAGHRRAKASVHSWLLRRRPVHPGPVIASTDTRSLTDCFNNVRGPNAWLDAAPYLSMAHAGSRDYGGPRPSSRRRPGCPPPSFRSGRGIVQPEEAPQPGTVRAGTQEGWNKRGKGRMPGNEREGAREGTREGTRQAREWLATWAAPSAWDRLAEWVGRGFGLAGRMRGCVRVCEVVCGGQVVCERRDMRGCLGAWMLNESSAYKASRQVRSEEMGFPAH